MIILVAPPAGPAYNFITDLYTYPGAWINGFVAIGLLYLQFNKSENWSSPFHTYLPVTLLFLVSNAFLAIVPFIPPTGPKDPEGYPFYVFPVVGVGVLLLGVLYWSVWTKGLPRLFGYKIVTERYVSDVDGSETVRYKKVYNKHL